MENKIIQDYGKTVASEVYINALQGHQYIPQSDQCIRNVIKNHIGENSKALVLDLGCGPARLTYSIAKNNPGRTLGIDISESFINYAKKDKDYDLMRGTVEFQLLDFSSLEEIKYSDEKFDVIFGQGVMHHIHGVDREVFLKKCFDLLKPNGIFIVGDEFIKDYENDKQRRLNVCKFYLHIIDEARKGGFSELAEEEAKNLIDDVFADTENAGFGNEEVFKMIYEFAEITNEHFYSGNHFECHASAQLLIQNLRKETEKISKTATDNFNRGDLKVSTNKFTDELQQKGFALEEKYEIGPVQQLGGMGVLVFMKR